MRHLFQFLPSIPSRRVQTEMESLSTDLARRSQGPVLKRVGDQVASLSPSEARGYIRARAALVIHREVDTVLSQRPRVPRGDREELVGLVAEQVLEQVVDALTVRNQPLFHYSKAA